MTKNRYCFPTALDGFIQIDEDGGKFGNRTFSFVIPEDVLPQMESDREELLEWAKTKAPNPKRVEVAFPKWDEETRLVKYTYGGDSKATEPVWVDTEGQVLDKAVLKAARKGTKVRVIVQQSPYVFGSKVGTKFKCLGVQVVELVSGNGAVDSGDLSATEVAELFGEVEGFKASSPVVRDERPAGEASGYDF